MVATPESFKILAKKVQRKDVDEASARELIAEYEDDHGLDEVPAKALRGVIKSCKTKGAQLLADPALEPAYVLKQWLGLPSDVPSDRSKEESEESEHVEQEEESAGNQSDQNSQPGKPKSKKRAKGSKKRSKKKANKNLLSQLKGALEEE